MYMEAVSIQGEFTQDVHLDGVILLGGRSPDPQGESAIKHGSLLPNS